MIPTVPKERFPRAQLYVVVTTPCRRCRCGLLLPTNRLILFEPGKTFALAIPHFSVSVVARGSGRSAVLSAAYRHCAKMDYAREARTVDYTRKQGLLHEEFVIPADAPLWLRAMIADRSVAGASEAFWNKVETFETRADAQLAKDVTIALPVELSSAQNIALMRDFIADHITSKGMVADWVYHDAPGNPHVHLMMTLRPLTEDGFGAKKIAVSGPDGNLRRNDAGKIIYELWAGNAVDFNVFRDGWFSCQNKHLARAGLDIRVDGRSFERQGLDLIPTIHIGVGATAIERKSVAAESALTLERIALQKGRRTENTRRIQRRPEIVLDMIMRERSVFDERDVAKILHRYVDDADLFQSLMARVLQSPQVLRIESARVEFVTGVGSPAKYTTRELIRLEAEMANRALWLAGRASHGVGNVVLEKMFARHCHLSQEQRTAIAHIAGSELIAAVIGRAGAGKTTMMKVAREVWEAAGYHVVGGALAGKAAEGLETEAGIISRTLCSWELRWSQGRDQLDDKTVFVLDEAGMVSSRQMALLVQATTRAGAKLILVGDPEQLQPIEAGAAFRAIADRIGYAELETIYRQREQWMRDASLDLARGDVDKAVDAYRSNGKIKGCELKAQAVEHLLADWARDYDPAKTTLILAHLRRDVRRLNDMARNLLVDRGIVEEGFAFRTEDGTRKFATGDHIVFLRNERTIGVKNGMLARVMEASPGRIIAETGVGEHRRQVIVEERFFNNVDHGYATTIHKSQGATVDRVKVLASLSLDRHLTYVAMTRHREDLAVFYGRRSFARAGGLVPLLSRKNAKETTLDYERVGFYAHALRFAEARGLHLIRVARTLVRDRLEWTIRQKRNLVDIGARLAAAGARLGFSSSAKADAAPLQVTQAIPMVAGITTFSKTLDQAVADKLKADPSVKRQWEEVTMRFRLVYAKPEAAFQAVDPDALLNDEAIAKSRLRELAVNPEIFGVLKGKKGMLASRADRFDHQRAVQNIPTLVESFREYLRLRSDAERRFEAEEMDVRRAMSIDIPALSPRAGKVIGRVRAAIDSHDLRSALEFASVDKMVKAELDGFARAVADRFGERRFLGTAARDADGETFRKISLNMLADQKSQLQGAWVWMRTIQQLAAHERTTTALKRAEVLGQTKSQGLWLK